MNIAEFLELPLVQLILNASFLVQLVMLLLFFVSIYSWTLIFRKGFILGRAWRQTRRFEVDFLKGRDLKMLYTQIANKRGNPIGIENIFIVGYLEFAKLRKQPAMTPDSLLEGVHRAMRATLQREMDRLDDSLTTLATVGSVSPYIGLFGTVWGIMHSFNALGEMKQVTLTIVAPGISEALVATAMGLFAAIPAVLAYNSYIEKVDRLATRYESFMDEFIGILHRQSHTLLTTAVKTTEGAG